MESLLQDVRFGARGLRHNPAFTCLAVLALALGIGGNTAIFSVVNSVLLRPLPYPQPERILAIFGSAPDRGLNQVPASYQRYTAYVEQNQSFDNIGAYTNDTVNLTGMGEPVQLNIARFSSGVLDVLQLKPAMGRNFTKAEDSRGGPPVAILSNSFWKQRFASDRQVIGRAVNLDGTSYTVIGVTPPDFAFGGPNVDLYVAKPFEPTYLLPEAVERGAGFLDIIGRLKSGVSRQQAQSELETIAKRSAIPDRLDNSLGVVTVPLPEQTTSNVRPTLLLLMAAVAFVLLIACANVANLLLAKAVVRQKEMAVRSALGAGRLRLVRQMLTESMLLALIAGGAGVLLAIWGVSLLVSAASGSLPRANEIGIDGSVLVFTLGVSLLTGLIFGLAPAVQVSRSDLNTTLKAEGRGATGGLRTNRTRAGLVIVEVALSLVLLVCASLMMRSVLSLRSVNPGFKPSNLLVANINLPQTRYKKPTEIAGFFRQLITKAKGLPGVESAAAVQTVPLTGGNPRTPIAIDGRPVPPVGERPIVALNMVTQDYFTTMGIPLIKGRTFNAQDNETNPQTLVIDQAFEKRFFPGENPIGKRLLIGLGTPREIVGVVGPVRETGLDQAPLEGFYMCADQVPRASMSIVMRTAVPPLTLGRALSSAVLSIDNDQPVASLQTMDQIVSTSISNRRLTLLLLGIFAGIALALASIGIYSVMAYSVTQRTREIGLRMALGAQGRDVMKLVIREGMIMALIGVAIGLGGAFALTRLMTSLLFGVSATDPTVFAGIAVTLAAVALIASYFPALRALKVGPSIALK